MNQAYVLVSVVALGVSFYLLLSFRCKLSFVVDFTLFGPLQVEKRWK